MTAQLITPLCEHSYGRANLLRERMMGDTQFLCRPDTFSENHAL